MDVGVTCGCFMQAGFGSQTHREHLHGSRWLIGIAAAILLLPSACVPIPRPATEPAGPGGAPLPPIPARTGPLAIDLVYPSEGWEVGTDSTFVFGNVGTGGATLRINGAPVEVAPNGAFLAYLPVPRDGCYDLIATRGGETARVTRVVRSSVTEGALPRGTFTRVAGESFEVRVPGAPGARARLLLPDGRIVPLVERRGTARAEGFLQDLTVPPREFTEYAGVFPVQAALAARDTGVAQPLLARLPPVARPAQLEWIRGAETTRVPLPINLAVLPESEIRVGVAQSPSPSGTIIGQAMPGSGSPYHWFFPTGTRLAITGEQSGMLRVRLTDDLSVWVNAADVRLLPPGTPAPRGSVGAIRVMPAGPDRDLRLATSERLPFRVDGSEQGLEVTVYGARSRTNWVHHSAQDSLVRRIEWEQPREDEYRVRVELAEPLWRWEPFWDADGNLTVRIHRAPQLDPRAPLRGVRIGVDAGHPPGGAIGPTRFTEAEANLEISRRLIALLRERGAEIVETRSDTAAVALGDRPARAVREQVDLLVSVHNNAFPDGVNPFAHAGTSVFYNQPQSLGLARGAERAAPGVRVSRSGDRPGGPGAGAPIRIPLHPDGNHVPDGA